MYQGPIYRIYRYIVLLQIYIIFLSDKVLWKVQFLRRVHLYKNFIIVFIYKLLCG